MDSTPPPTKPPRGVKNSKESSGLLMSVIKTLNASESNEQRDEERTRLEKEYKKSNQQLDQLVSIHHQDLTAVMKLFGRVSLLISTSQQKVHLVKENLNACKRLLTCRREELKRLWLESTEHKHELYLLEQIDQMKQVPSQLSNYKSEKQYLKATRLLVSMINLTQTTLKGVDALRELTKELDIKKQELYKSILEELNDQIYMESTKEVMRLRRQGSAREASDHGQTPLQRIMERKISIRRSQNKVRRNIEFPTPSRCKDILEITEETEFSDDIEHNISITVECIALLQKEQDSLEELKQRLQKELLRLSQRTSKELQGMDTNLQKMALVDFFQLLMEQFRCVVDSHKLLLQCFGKKCKISSSSSSKYSSIYTISDVWIQIQAVMEILLTDYLDVKSSIKTNSKLKEEKVNDPSVRHYDIASFFTRRKYQRVVKGLLFKFNSSSVDVNLQSQDVRESELNSKEKILICEPSPHHVTLLFLPINNFIKEIEMELALPKEERCRLNVFINEYVEQIFLDKHDANVFNILEKTADNADCWRAVTSIYENRPLPTTVFTSTVKVVEILRDVINVMETLPTHKKHFKGLIIRILKTYKDTCQSAYRKIVQSKDKYVHSALWLKDNTVRSHLKSAINLTKSDNTNNWLNKNSKYGGKKDGKDDNERRYSKEADVLNKMMDGNTGISNNDIINDMSYLKCLAQLQESLEWFSYCIDEFINGDGFHNRLINNNIPKIKIISVEDDQSEENESLKQLSSEFKELADTCIFVLHLEVRVQCFYYLLPKTGNNNNNDNNNRTCYSDTTDDPDPKVLELSRTISGIDEVLSTILQPPKIKFIFEGIGTLVSKILLSWTISMERIDEMVIHKICRNIHTIQQTLYTITDVRETSLDIAKQYFQLFFSSPEDIIKDIEKKGAKFTEMEYINVLQLIHKCRPEYSDEQIHNKYLQKLATLFSTKTLIV